MAGSGSNPSPEKDPLSCSPSPSESAAPSRPHILIVEDNKADLFLIREAIAAAKLDAELHVMQDGEKAIRYFEEVDADDSISVPALVVIDINLPKKHGSEVLDVMRRSRRCAGARVIVVTSSDFDRDREQMARLGADVYFRKPSDYDEFMKVGGMIRSLVEPAAAI